MTKISTTIEQSKKLLELGLNPDTANMCYDTAYVEGYPTVLDENGLCDTMPCWSLETLLDTIKQQLSNYYLTIDSCVGKDGEWQISIFSYSDGFVAAFQSKDLLDAAYETMVWLFQNGYV